jgi:hypothetical protein
MNKKLIIIALISGLILIVITCKELKKEMMVTTGEVTSFTKNNAVVSGMVVDIGEGVTEHGHCFAKTTSVTTGNQKTQLGSQKSTGGFTSQLANLEAGTKYYIKAYVSNGSETVYGKEISFTTLAATLPVLTTTAISSPTTTTATSGGNITDDGGASVTARGVCWNTAPSPSISNTKTTDGTGTGTFASNLTGLTAGTTYYVRAYATNSAGTAYGNELNFNTNPPVLPTVTTATVGSLTQTSATSGGTVTSDGGAPVTARGICWSTNLNPTVFDPRTNDGTGTGPFVSNMTNLTPATAYHVRAYAVNSAGTAYGSDLPFTTSLPIDVPAVTTDVISSITATSAVSGGNVTSDGGAAVTVKGVCWGTTSGPVITSGNRTGDGSGTGTFISTITGLNPKTTYYVRAYATNSAGTGYGNERSFPTSDVAPAAPTNLIADATDPSSITLTWSDNSANETGFEIQRYNTDQSGTYVTVTTVGANVTQFRHTDLSETWPGYQVRAVNGAGQSAFSNVALAPAKLRIINDLYSTATLPANDWPNWNKIVRVRIGPSYSSLDDSNGNTYERLCPYDYLTESQFTTYGDWINPAYNATTYYKDFPVSTYGYGSSYYFYLRCGFWQYYTGTPNYYSKLLTWVLCSDGISTCAKYTWIQVTNHTSGYFVVTATEARLPYGTYSGVVKGGGAGITLDARSPSSK